jgi:hypothetical protein
LVPTVLENAGAPGVVLIRFEDDLATFQADGSADGEI